MSHRILVLEGITERGAEILRAEGWTVDMEKALPPAELVKLVPPYDAILVRSGSQMNAEVIEAAKSLQGDRAGRRRRRQRGPRRPPPAAASS